MEYRKADLPTVTFRAEPATIDVKARTVELIFTTGAPVVRLDGYGGRYIERLSLQPGHVRLERLNAGAPLLDTHQARSITNMLGTVVPGSARLLGGYGLATVRFSERPDAEAAFRDVAAGIIKSVSTGYATHKVTIDEPRKGESLPTRTAVDWEPYEISLVSMPADVGARVRTPTTVTDADRHRMLALAQARAGLPFAAITRTDADRRREFARLQAIGRLA